MSYNQEIIENKTSEDDISIGVGRTAVFVAACRAILTNKFLELLKKDDQSKNSTNSKLEENYKEIKENAKKLEYIYQEMDPSHETLKMLTRLDICIFDPYALAFCIGKGPEKLLIDTFKNQQDGSNIEKFQEFVQNVPILVAWGELLNKSAIFRMTFRTKFIDDFVLENNEKFDQVVVLGAGLDCRALRLPFRSECTIFEIDLPHVIQFKESVLEPIISMIPRISKSKIVRFSGDLCNNNESDNNSWVYQLNSNGFNQSKPTLWLMEGLVMYIEKSKLDLIFNSIDKLSSSESKLLVHTVNTTFGISATGSTPTTNDNRDYKVDWTVLKEEFISRHDNPIEEILNPNHFSKDAISLDYQQICEKFNFKFPESIRSSTKFSIGTKI